MARCASALDLPDYAALLVMVMVLVLVVAAVVRGIADFQESAVGLRTLSRPLSEEWVIICAQRSDIRAQSLTAAATLSNISSVVNHLCRYF